MDRDMDRTDTRPDRGERTWPEWLTLAFGVTYLLVGLLGFTVTDGVGFTDNQGDLLLGIFEVNPLHNIVHLAIGAALVGGFMGGRRSTAAVATIVGVTYLLVAIAGPFVTGDDSEANILALNTADHWLHALSALALIVAGVVAMRPDTRHGLEADRRDDLRRAA